MTKTINQLKVQSVEHLDSNVVNLDLSFDTGLNYYEGGINIDVSLESNEDSVLVSQSKINFVEDENEEPVKFNYNVKELNSKIENLLNDAMNQTHTNENERQIILALS